MSTHRLEALLDHYRRYVRDPATATPWRDVFSRLDEDAKAWLDARLDGSAPAVAGAPVETGVPASDAEQAARDSTRALMFIRVHRVRGHLQASLDPLGLANPERHPELQPETYGFTEADMDRPIFLDGVMGMQSATMREIVAAVRTTFCGPVGLEYMHLQDPAQKAWIQERMESPEHRATLTDADRLDILERLTAAEAFEKFLDKKYTGTKRFGLEGAETTIPALETIVRTAVGLGVDEIVLGMAHRGRLNVLANVMEKPLTAIFHEFKGGSSTPEEIGGSGDVKYHLGTSTDREIGGNWVHLSLTPNPSHLEAVDPVVVGKVRARQDLVGDGDKNRVIGILLHGDAAFAGQGVVAETLQFLELPGYRTGGTIHFIINNQIGFTTNPMIGRSSPYSSDVAKAVQAPIVHVNGDSPEAVVLVAKFAMEFRQTFKRDVVIDMVCYRRHGHNEGDEPAFTQPLMYRAIRNHPTTLTLYAQKLARDGIVSKDQSAKLAADWDDLLESQFQLAESYQASHAEWLEGSWSGLEPVKDYDPRRGDTQSTLEDLQEVGAALVRVPEGFNLNRKITRQLKTKARMFETGEGIDWGTGEALAYGTLLLEGHPVRLSGEDSNRGTFSHRHASWVDQETEEKHIPLNHIREDQGKIDILDSPLSEFGVLGFEYGYAMAAPNALVLWEAQFGDFANGAQVIIDQFLAAGEVKWLRMNGLVLLLPHGYEGQGPEHSSARLERFLSLCAEDNLQVVNLTTPAQIFHALRRQMKRKFRKPLVVMAPKSLLRHKRAVSKLAEFGPGSHFHRVLEEDVPPSSAKEAKQVVVCSGKVYYDLLEERESRKITDVHLVRMEQLYPFPMDALVHVLRPYAHCRFVWCQEESRNMGAWPVVGEMLGEVAEAIGARHPEFRYAGRRTSASPATGRASRHREEQIALVDEALTVGLEHKGRVKARVARDARRGDNSSPSSPRPKGGGKTRRKAGSQRVSSK